MFCTYPVQKFISIGISMFTSTLWHQSLKYDLIHSLALPLFNRNLIRTVTYHGEHNQRLLLNHTESLPELLRYLEHLTIHYLIHSLLL